MNESAPIDAAAIASIREIGGEELLVKLIDLFGNYVGGRIAAAKNAVAEGNIGAVQDAVHPVKSSAANLGAHHVRELARQIEQLARSGTMAPIPVRLAEMELAFVIARDALEKIRAGSPEAKNQ